MPTPGLSESNAKTAGPSEGLGSVVRYSSKTSGTTFSFAVSYEAAARWLFAGSSRRSFLDRIAADHSYLLPLKEPDWHVTALPRTRMSPGAFLVVCTWPSNVEWSL